MSRALFKTAAARAMDTKGLTKKDKRLVRHFFRNKLPRRKVNLVLSTFSDGTITKREHKRLIATFGRRYACVIDSIVGGDGKGIAHIQQNLRKASKSTGTARLKAHINILNTLYWLMGYKVFSRCKLQLNSPAYSNQVMNAMLELMANPALSKGQYWGRHSPTGLTYLNGTSVSEWFNAFNLKKRYIKKLIKILKTGPIEARQGAAFALVSHASPRWRVYRQALKPLHEALKKDKNATVREWIITALGNSNARSTRAALIRAGRTDPVRSVRVDAAKALCRFREKDARVKKFFKWYYSKPRSCVEQCYVPGGVNCDPDDGDDD